jgi:hypothetical protein
MKTVSFSALLLLVASVTLSAQYNTQEQLSGRVKALERNQDIVATTSLAITAGGRNIFLIRAGKGDADNKPGIAIIGGIDGAVPASTEIVLQLAEKLVRQNPALLDSVTFYFLPNVSPDATAQYEVLRYERKRNSVAVDEDKDGLVDEDGYDDMNNDGVISQMRILDPAKGDFFVHPGNPAVMVKADVSKGQRGNYRVLSEGFDNDKDAQINEDLPGGTMFNKNFSFRYPYFSEGAGANALSELETRAVARFLFDHWNIFVVLCIGPENNLSEYNDLAADMVDKSIPSAVSEKDKPYVERIIHMYTQHVRLADSAKVAPTGGDLLSWAYFHYNRYAFSTPGWNVPKDNKDLGSGDYDFLKFAEKRGISGVALPWQAMKHPDFPDNTVEIGGILPFAAKNPPLALLDTAADHHLGFLLALASQHPSLQFNQVKVTRTSGNISLVEAEITNIGGLPTMPFLAVNSKWVKKIRVEIHPSEKQTVAGGKKVFLRDRMVPGEPVKVSWLVSGKGKVVLRAGSPQTGTITREVELK